MRSGPVGLVVIAAVLVGASGARADDAMERGREGGAFGLAIRAGGIQYRAGGGSRAGGFELMLGRSAGRRTMVLGRFAVSAQLDEHAFTSEVGLAARVWLRRWRLYAEPQLSYAVFSPEQECYDDPCESLDHLGVGLGVAAGVELLSTPHFSVDLRLSAGWMVLADIDDELHALGGLAFTCF